MLVLFAPLAAVMAAGSAMAQSNEFILDDDAHGETTWQRADDAPAPGTDAAMIADVRRLLAEGEPAKAKRRLTEWLDAHERTDNPNLAEAYYLRGDAWLALDQEYQSLFDYETVVRDFPDSEFFALAVEREYGIGVRYLHGLRRRIFGMRLENGKPTGEELLIRTQERMPGSRLAEEAALTLADYYYDERKLELAGDMYSIFLANYPRSEHRERAMLRRIDCNVARFKGPEYDGSSLVEARLLLETYEQEYPANAARAGFSEGMLTWIDESGAQQMLESARWYLQVHDEPSARLVLRRLVRSHPESGAAQQAVRMMTEKGWLEESTGDRP